MQIASNNCWRWGKCGLSTWIINQICLHDLSIYWRFKLCVVTYIESDGDASSALIEIEGGCDSTISLIVTQMSEFSTKPNSHTRLSAASPWESSAIKLNWRRYLGSRSERESHASRTRKFQCQPRRELEIFISIVRSAREEKKNVNGKF